MPRITSCKDCTDRFRGCHDICEKYLSQKNADLEARERYKKEHHGDILLHQYCSEKAVKSMRKKK